MDELRDEAQHLKRLVPQKGSFTNRTVSEYGIPQQFGFCTSLLCGGNILCVIAKLPSKNYLQHSLIVHLDTEG